MFQFLPEDGIEKIIGLRERLKRRIKENTDLLGSGEIFFEGDPINITDLYNESSGFLNADDEDAEVDLGSQALKIWDESVKTQPEFGQTVAHYRNA